jgi:thiol-disulfide isomerase/thioredoxin
MTESEKRAASEESVEASQESEPKKQKTEETATKEIASDEDITEENGTPNEDTTNLAAMFPSLKTSLESTDCPILALYFSSEWCSDCQESAPVVSKVFKSQKEDSKLFDLIYVSSDKDAKQMEENVDEGWGAIPFENEDERSNIKRHYGACASKEVEPLGMKPEDRKSGIPTLILLDKKTGNTLLADAVPDIMGETKVDDPLEKWKSMLS